MFVWDGSFSNFVPFITNDMTLTERRLAIVEDAISQLKSEKYVTGEFGYVKLPESLEEMPADTQVQPYLCETQESCGVCAKGALLLSTVRQENKLVFSDLGKHSDLIDRLTDDGLFEEHNLHLIEAYYENYRLYYDRSRGVVAVDLWFCLHHCPAGVLKEEDVPVYNKDIQSFVEKYPAGLNHNRTNRLLAILENMKANKGVFKPI